MFIHSVPFTESIYIGKQIFSHTKHAKILGKHLRIATTRVKPNIDELASEKVKLGNFETRNSKLEYRGYTPREEASQIYFQLITHPIFLA